MAEVRLDVDLGHPPDRVWHALTDQRLLERWLLPGAWTTTRGAAFPVHPRHDARFTGPIDVEILDAVPQCRLVMQWTSPGMHSQMTWTLQPTATGCRLSVLQTGFLGTPQAQRCHQLREAYQEKFGQALRLALAIPDPGAGLPARAPRRTPPSVAGLTRRAQRPVRGSP